MWLSLQLYATSWLRCIWFVSIGICSIPVSGWQLKNATNCKQFLSVEIQNYPWSDWNFEKEHSICTRSGKSFSWAGLRTSACRGQHQILQELSTTRKFSWPIFFWHIRRALLKMDRTGRWQESLHPVLLSFWYPIFQSFISSFSPPNVTGICNCLVTIGYAPHTILQL